MMVCDHCQLREAYIPFYGEVVCFECAEHNRPDVVMKDSYGETTLDHRNPRPWTPYAKNYRQR